MGFLAPEDDEDDGPFSPEIRLTSEIPDVASVAVTNRFFVPRNRRVTELVGFGLPFEDAPKETIGTVLDQWCAYVDALVVGFIRL